MHNPHRVQVKVNRQSTF